MLVGALFIVGACLFVNQGYTKIDRARRRHTAKGKRWTRRHYFRETATTTTVRDLRVRPAEDLVHRQFAATAPDQLWVADITYIPTWAGFLYLAVVLDMFNRRIVGWAMATHLRTELVLDAMDMALGRRRPLNVKGKTGPGRIVDLRRAGSVSIVRHVKVQGKANPYDRDHDGYFRARAARGWARLHPLQTGCTI